MPELFKRLATPLDRAIVNPTGAAGPRMESDDSCAAQK
jgi:hypothetical protein